MMQQHNWKRTLAFGDRAAEDIVRILRTRGHAVVDLTKLPSAQRRGVDYLIDDEYVDIKADTHRAEAIFLELECRDQPGCFFKSRADAWLYYFPREQRLYRLDLPALQHHIARNLAKYRERAAMSVSGQNTWYAVGAIVPLADLIALGIAEDLSDLLEQPHNETIENAEAAV